MERDLPLEVVEQVWQKAQPVHRLDPASVRQDCFGAWIYRHAFGDRASAYGWDLDYIVPPDCGGRGELDNLRPLQWQNSLMRGQGRLGRAVSALGLGNALLIID